MNLVQVQFRDRKCGEFTGRAFLPPAVAEKLGVELTTVERIFAEADYVSLHIPENDETRGMINAKLFALMKEGAMLINCARAGVINEDDLRAAKAGKKLFFCNDVYPKDAAGPWSPHKPWQATGLR